MRRKITALLLAGLVAALPTFAAAVEVTLARAGAAQKDGADAPINGVLRFYGASTVEAFANPVLEPLGNAVLSDDDFSEGETAAADIPLEPDAGAKFLKARIEERKEK